MDRPGQLTKRIRPEDAGSRSEALWVVAPWSHARTDSGSRALAQIVETCSGVVLVDSDDVLHASRVAAARADLQASDLAGCALCLVDQQGKDLGLTFGLPPQLGPEDVFPRNNVFGFSNSAFRSDLSRRCLPIPADAVLVDWFLATRAWLLGARLAFDRVPRMDYRQHPANTARVRSPFTPDQVISDTELVRQHFQLLLAAPMEDYLADRYADLRESGRELKNSTSVLSFIPRSWTATFKPSSPAPCRRFGGLVLPIQR